MAKTNTLRLQDQMLTNIAHGYKQAEAVGELLFPTVKVKKSAGSIAKFGKEAFRLVNTRRAHNGDLNEMDLTGASTVTYKLYEDQIKMRFETSDVEESEFFNLENKATNDAMKILSLSKEDNIATLAQATANYASGNFVTLSDDYLNEAAIDPIKYIWTQNDVIKSKTGSNANTMVIPSFVWKWLKYHPKIKSDYFGSNEAQLITINKLKELFEIQNIVIASGVKINDPLTEDFTQIWGNNIILAFTAPAQEGIDRTEYEPSFGYTLQKEGSPSVTKFADESGTFQHVNVVDKYQPLVLGNTAGFLIKNPIDPAVYGT